MQAQFRHVLMITDAGGAAPAPCPARYRDAMWWLRWRKRPAGSGELYASDPYSDIELGRQHPTHPYRDVTESSQIADPPSRDLLDLPDEDGER